MPDLEDSEFKPRAQCAVCLGMIWANTDRDAEANLKDHLTLAHPWVEVKVRKESAIT